MLSKLSAAPQLTNVYGSPSMDDTSAFSRLFYDALEKELGEEVAGDLAIEVSSPVDPQLFLLSLLFGGREK